MSVLFVCLAVSFAAGLITWWMARTWWRVDAGAPHLTAGTIESNVRRHVRVARWLRAHVNAEMATGSLLVALAVVAIVGGGLFGVILAMVRSHRGFTTFDTSAARFGAHHATHTSTQVLRTITQAGGAYVIVPLAVVVGLIEARRLRSWATAAFLVVVVGGQYLLADVIKAIVDRARPDLLRLTGFSGPSFPSGHATAAAATFAAFALLLGRGRSPRTKALLAAVAVGAAVLISATRVMLGVHWLTDVVAGLLLGWTWFVISSIAFGGRRLRFGAPLATAELVTDEVTPIDDGLPTHPRAAVRSGARPA
jgi:undecaprenyl-diphosphatase